MSKLLFAFVAVFISAPGQAALVDIVVTGTWENASGNTTINPFGILVNDTFTMHATYDDTSFFNGVEGVTAVLEPGVNSGTMFEVIIPHAAGAPNPLVFTHLDHISIGFAPWAQIQFDGTDATTDPGVFRNFEIHVEFNLGGQNFNLDLYFFEEPRSELYNISESGALAAQSIGADHLEIVPIPAAVWLFGSALGLLGWMKRKAR